MTLSRREFVRKSALTLSFTLAGSKMFLTPAQARVKQVPFKVLSAEDVAVLESTCEIILPGASEAGVAHFVDHQLAVDPNDSLLALKYFNFPPPYADFYRPVLKQFALHCQRLFDKSIARLDEKQGKEFVMSFRDANPDGWQGPPAPLAYMALRNDATDVFYGTPEGFKKLGIPYMEHILPPENWS